MGEIARVGKAATIFERLIGRFGKHAVAGSHGTYIQPYVYLSLYLVQMQAQGWDVDYDQIAVVSGASALLGYKANAFQPKYAHLLVPLHADLDLRPDEASLVASRGIDQRIAAATGFCQVWSPFEGPEDAWQQLKSIIDEGLLAKGHDWEGILFGGYRDTTSKADRWIFAMADGPETYAKWISWDDFTSWVTRVTEWNHAELGYYNGRCPTATPREIATRVLKDLVVWSTDPPERITTAFPKAVWGLEGIEAYATDCADVDQFPGWVACHGINPQWTIRNATGIYLERIAEMGIFDEPINAHLRTAAVRYRAIYDCWAAFYRLLGPGTPKPAQEARRHREAGAAVVHGWLDHEKAALAEIEAALTTL